MIGLFLFLYAVTRLVAVMALPIFLDEAVHLQWAERIFSEGRIVRPIGSGRLLAVVAYGMALPFDDRLLAARSIAIVAGAITLVISMTLARKLFGPPAAAACGTLYLLSPLALVYDRLALSDGFLSAAVSALMLATFAIAKEPGSRKPVVFAGLALVLAILSKVSALVFAFTLPIGAVLLSVDRGKALRRGAMAASLGLVLASPMLLVFAANSGEISAQHLLDPGAAGIQMSETLSAMREWIGSYFSFVAVIAAFAAALILRDARAAWLGPSALLPFAIFALVGQPWSARYILPALPAFLILLAGGIARATEHRFPNRASPAIFLAAALSAPLLTLDRDLLTDPSSAALPSDDRRQLITGWPSGFGVRELALRLQREDTAPATAYVDTGGTRTVASTLPILLGRRSRIRLIEIDLKNEAARAEMVQVAREGRVFAIVGPRADDFEFKTSVEGARLDRLDVFVRPGGDWAVSLFEVRAEAAALRSDPRLF